MNFFQRFLIFTQSMLTFEGQRAYEHTLAVLYRHWFVLVGRVAGFIVALLVPLAVLRFGEAFIVSAGLASLVNALVWLYLFVVWYRFFAVLTMYLLDVWIITDHRIIDSEQHGFFSRTVSEMSMERVQDVSVQVSGFIQTLLDFGNVEIQTAGASEKFVFKQVAHPQQVKDLIMQAHRDFLAAHAAGGHDHGE